MHFAKIYFATKGSWKQDATSTGIASLKFPMRLAIWPVGRMLDDRPVSTDLRAAGQISIASGHTAPNTPERNSIERTAIGKQNGSHRHDLRVRVCCQREKERKTVRTDTTFESEFVANGDAPTLCANIDFSRLDWGQVMVRRPDRNQCRETMVGNDLSLATFHSGMGKS